MTTLDERILGAATGTLELYSIHLGRSLGLYRALEHPLTTTQLAERAGIDERYAREWLEQQAIAGLITADANATNWQDRKYTLTDEQRRALVDATDPTHVSPLADMVAGIGGVLTQVADAYRSGDGVPYAKYGAAFRGGQGGINRPAFTHDLPGEWLDAIPDVKQRLATGGGRVADVGCGTGWASIAVAATYPKAEVWGFDIDAASIADARANAAEAASTARFESIGGDSIASYGPFDLVLILETLHDMADPVGALAHAREILTPGGAVLIADEKVAENFTAPGNDLERMMYGWSIVHCLPASLAEPNSAGIGTVLRPQLVRVMAQEAGFGSVETSNIDAGFFNLYVLRD